MSLHHNKHLADRIPESCSNRKVVRLSDQQVRGRTIELVRAGGIVHAALRLVSAEINEMMAVHRDRRDKWTACFQTRVRHRLAAVRIAPVRHIRAHANLNRFERMGRRCVESPRGAGRRSGIFRLVRRFDGQRSGGMDNCTCAKRPGRIENEFARSRQVHAAAAEKIADSRRSTRSDVKTRIDAIGDALEFGRLAAFRIDDIGAIRHAILRPDAAKRAGINDGHRLAVDTASCDDLEREPCHRVK